MVFSKLDLEEAFNQLPVSEETSNLLFINMSRGLFRYRRLPFGVHVAPSLFQQRIEEITRDLDGVLAFFDNLLIGGKDETECMARTYQLCERLVEKGAWRSASFSQKGYRTLDTPFPHRDCLQNRTRWPAYRVVLKDCPKAV